MMLIFLYSESSETFLGAMGAREDEYFQLIKDFHIPHMSVFSPLIRLRKARAETSGPLG